MISPNVVEAASLQRAYAGKRILITGGLGFIGSTLAIALVSLGAEVTVIDSLIPEYGADFTRLHSLTGGQPGKAGCL